MFQTNFSKISHGLGGGSFLSSPCLGLICLDLIHNSFSVIESLKWSKHCQILSTLWNWYWALLNLRTMSKMLYCCLCLSKLTCPLSLQSLLPGYHFGIVTLVMHIFYLGWCFIRISLKWLMDLVVPPSFHRPVLA